SLGRHVLQGARAKEVIVPLLAKERAPDPEPAPEGETPDEKRARVARLIGFKVVRAVFAYSDTDGPEIPPKPLPKWDMDKALDTLKIKRIPFQHLSGNVQGYSVERELAINPMAVYPEKTMLHEMGHIILGHTVTTNLGEYAQHRGLMEFQAEATAYLAGHELDLYEEESAANSRGYIQTWLKDEQPSERAIRLVFAVTDQILRSGRVLKEQP
ncbi:MAG TPA: hypothetical protein VJN88_11540, partial [Ktedonobacterales bacterium]|nr:hypothetical protein [Ktedonobacterales bacterium]